MLGMIMKMNAKSIDNQESQYNNSMNKTLTALYYENLAKFQKGEITHEVWCEFCANILAQLMLDNQ